MKKIIYVVELIVEEPVGPRKEHVELSYRNFQFDHKYQADDFMKAMRKKGYPYGLKVGRYQLTGSKSK